MTNVKIDISVGLWGRDNRIKFVNEIRMHLVWFYGISTVEFNISIQSKYQNSSISDKTV